MLKAVLLLLTFFFSDSHQQCFSQNDAVEFLTPHDVDDWVAARNNFTVSLFKSLEKERNQNNVILAPISVHEALMTAYFGAVSDTEASLAKVLELPKNQKKALVWRIYNNQKLMNARKETQNYPLKNANKLFISSKLRLRQCMQEKFRKDVEYVDYQKDAGLAKTHINQWIERQTDGKIQDHVNDLSPKTTAFLVSTEGSNDVNNTRAVFKVNTVYLKGQWLNSFNPDETQYIPFRVNTYETRRINMMVKTASFEIGHHPQLGARTLLLPYQDNRVGMIILLPDRGLDIMLESLNIKTMEYLFDRRNFKRNNVKLYIPKFQHRHKMDIEKILKPLGIGNTFTKFADFSGFTGRKEIFVEKLIHEAVFEIDEEGTKGTHVTTYSALQRPFICDRPFAYAIYDFMVKKILFLGTFRDPQQVVDG